MKNISYQGKFRKQLYLLPGHIILCVIMALPSKIFEFETGFTISFFSILVIVSEYLTFLIYYYMKAENEQAMALDNQKFAGKEDLGGKSIVIGTFSMLLFLLYQLSM